MNPAIIILLLAVVMLACAVGKSSKNVSASYWTIGILIGMIPMLTLLLKWWITGTA